MDFTFLFALIPVAFFVVLMGVAFALIDIQQEKEKAWGKRLNLQGASATGQIVKHRVERLNRGCRCYLTCRYWFEDVEYEYEQPVSIEGFNSVRDGETIKVRFFPHDLSTRRLVPIDRFRLLL